MKKFIIAGNWKMNTSLKEASNIANTLNELDNTQLSNEIIICPPFLWLEPIKKIISSEKIHIGSQNCYYQPNGAYTGEISISMLEELGIEYSIIGHSERRQLFYEDDELINKKLQALLKSKVKPILCIGETLEERQQNKTFEIVTTQIKKAFANINISDLDKITIAYEPIWAIGTGVSATKEQAQEVHLFIRNFLNQFYNSSAQNIKILYGGSLNDKNAEELLNMPDIDGGLIGGASLKIDSFIKIIQIAENISLG